jgi:uncharacterized circularly permuted ATP-grasp superfamily protein/uncharacterized alpha-E superfamily protein
MSTTLTPPRSATPSDLFANYAATAGVYDEMFAAPGVVRPHWQRFAAAINQLGAHELTRRWDQARRLIHENGISYNAYGDTRDHARPWAFGALPLLVAADEWGVISASLQQRARLLNLVLADLYGPQKLLQQGLVPPELVFAHPGFLRSYHGQKLPSNNFLHLYAVDLARSADGNWWVMADRTETPSGAGYALENRIVSSRMLPQIFHNCQVERLAPFFIALRETLESLAPRQRDNPRIVLLTQGPTNPNYFEDAYLARYLGYTLVEGGDLTVRENRVLLKTLGGLLPVDVILRRLDSEYCDSLELRSDSVMGVAGLVEAARSGNVAIANALGSGLVESPAFLSILPRLSQELLGEDLKLPNVPTWWCGDSQSLDHVLANLDRLVISPAFRRRATESHERIHLDRLSREQLSDLIRARPLQYVAQERPPRSTAPIWNEGAMQPWHVAMRPFLVASGDSYTTLPGGLTRASAASGPLEIAMTAGDKSKDTWVLAEGPVRVVSLLQPPGSPVELLRSGTGLPSRVADNLFWLGRQVERAECSARLLRTVLTRLSGELVFERIAEMPALLRALASQGQIEPGFVVEGIREQLPAVEAVLPASVFDDTQSGSLRSTIVQMHRVAGLVRDRMSVDMWRIINRVDQDFQPPRRSGAIDAADVLARLNQMMIDLGAFSGLMYDSMTRTHGWRFLMIGRSLERALQLVSLLANTLTDSLDANEAAVLEAVLEVGDSSMTYRSRYLSNLQIAPVVDLLLVDETNPRSLAYQLVELYEHVEQLPRDTAEAKRSAEQRIVLSALSSVRLVDIVSLCEAQPGKGRPMLERLLHRLATQLPKLSDAIGHRYLIHAGAPRQLAEVRPE